MLRPTHQVVRVHPAIENEKARTAGRPTVSDSGPMRCQLWDGRRLVTTIPVMFDDMGHPSDVVFQPRRTERISRLAFIWGGKVFTYPLETQLIKKGESLHLALGHLKLLDRFGIDILKAGRN